MSKLPVAPEQEFTTTVYIHYCPECGDPTDEYLESMAGEEQECPLCDTKYTVATTNGKDGADVASKIPQL